MIEALRTRRSIRRYSDQSIAPEHLDLLQEALLRSPSSRGINPWEFIFVDDGDTLKNLSQTKAAGAQFLKGAALGIVVCGNEDQSDVWIEDCAIASVLVQMAAHSIGLASCWIQIRNRLHADGLPAEKHVQQLLHIPSQLRVLSIVSIGYAAEDLPGHPAESLLSERIHTNQY